jgi:hypothetical protein
MTQHEGRLELNQTDTAMVLDENLQLRKESFQL